jgi:RNA polymerase sigma-70 factor (ECF subfamily)
VAEGPGGAEEEEAALVAKAIDGDQRAFTALYDRHHDRIYRHIIYRVRRVEDVEDLTQQVFLQAWRALGRYRQTGSPFIAWLLTIAHNVVVSFYRRNKVVYSLEADLPEPASEERMEGIAEARLEGERVRNAMVFLRPEQQQVLTMRFLEHLEYRDIAQAVGKSEGNVRVIQHRALQELRRLLQRGDA